MFLELVDSLRCVRSHEDSWLVARADELAARHIVTGELGCPVCQTRYPVRAGIADFRLGDAEPASPSSAATREDERAALALRAAALLGLTEPGGLVILAGTWSAAAPALLEMTEGVLVLALNAPPDIESGGALSIARIAQVLPLAAQSARGIALDASHATPSLLAGAARALTAGARLIAPASAPVPDTLKELARDAEHWVAEATHPSAMSAPIPITLKR